MPMLIQKGIASEIPSDAVVITEEEALKRQWQIVRDWRKRSEVWPLRYGGTIVSGLSAISALILTNHYRARLRLRSYGMIPMYLPTVFLPSFASAVYHKTDITSAVLLQSEECPLCIQGRSIVAQFFFSIALPMCLAPIGSCYYAMATGSYNVPPLQIQYIPELGRLWLSMTQKLKLKLPILIGTNLLSAAILAYLEQDCFFKLQRKLYEEEEELRNKLSSNS